MNAIGNNVLITHPGAVFNRWLSSVKYSTVSNTAREQTAHIQLELHKYTVQWVIQPGNKLPTFNWCYTNTQYSE